MTCKNLYLMDPEKINYDLIEIVITWIVDGEHDFPAQGCILVSTCIYCEKSPPTHPPPPLSLSLSFIRQINLCFFIVSVSILQMVLSRFQTDQVDSSDNSS